MGASLGASKQPKPLLSFRAVLNAQLDQTLSYASLKRLLRALKTSSAISSYPSRTTSQPLLTLSLTQPSQPLPSSSQNQSQSLQQSADRGASHPTTSDRPSRLRRKRRSSRRPPVNLFSKDVQRELFLTPGSSPTPFQPSPDPDHDASQLCAVGLLDVQGAASFINRHLNNLIGTCPSHGVVTWPQLRKALLNADDQTYTSFCNYIDSVGTFDSDEPLATGRPGSPSTKSCVYYSNQFWEQVLQDFRVSISSQ